MDQADAVVTTAAQPRSYGWVLERTDCAGLYLILGRGGQMWGTSIVGATHFCRERDAQGYAAAHCPAVGVKPARDVR